MSTTSTASNYINKIDEFYPIAGKDNNSQGFRDNFKNTKTSLQYLDEDIHSLKTNSVTLKTPVNNFNNNIIKQAIFQDCGTIVLDNTLEIKSGYIVVNYENGNFQKYKFTSGTHVISIANWPGTNRSGSMLLSVSTSTSSATYVTFSSTNVYSSVALPVQITGTAPTMFQVWSDGTLDNLYVQKL